MMKKISLTLCAAALLAACAFATYINAQKGTDAPAAAPDKHDAQTHDAQTHDAQAHAECPFMRGGEPGAQTGGGHDAHLAGVNARGESAMGFSQTETAHHFRLARDGGSIEVEAKDPADALNRDRIKQHLAHVARMFAAGDFDIPLLVHARTVPGTHTMSRLKSEIVYTFEETERGARVRITTGNSEALAAVHEFLRFQIEDHQTGDKQ